MLDGLDAIDWGSLQDAFGSARMVPDHLRALLANDDGVRHKAVQELFVTVWHQGTIYSVSAYVVPFLIELIEAPEVRDKHLLLLLLASIASGRGYYEVHEPVLRELVNGPVDLSAKRSGEIKAVAAVRRAMSPHIATLISHLQDPEPEVKLAIAEALPFYPQHSALTREALQRARASESNPDVLEGFVEALARIPQTD